MTQGETECSPLRSSLEKKKSGDLQGSITSWLAAMSLTPCEESPGGSYTELEEMQSNQTKPTAGLTVVISSAVAGQSEAQAEDLEERNVKESGKCPYSMSIPNG